MTRRDARDRPLRWRRAAIRTVQATADVVLAGTATALAVVLLIGPPGRDASGTAAGLVLAALTGTWLIAVAASGSARIAWSRLSFHDVRRLALALAAATVGATVTLAMLRPLALRAAAAAAPGGADVAPLLPAAAPLAGALTLLALLLARGLAREAHELRYVRPRARRRTRRVLLAGAGEAGTQLARAIERHPETLRRAVGFVDDDPAKSGRRYAGVPVLGTLTDLPDLLRREHVDEVIVTFPSADGAAVRRVVDAVRRTAPEVAHRIVPPLHELATGAASIERLRDVAIDDLLRRPPVVLDEGAILSHLRGRRVMITGAGGSIGSELVRQICRFSPDRLLLFGHGENSIYQLERDLDRAWPDLRYESVIGAVQNAVRLEHVLRSFRPEIVFHTAAHKHVPLMETNPEEAVFNNVVGSRNLVRLALQAGVTHFVNVSTDKAVAPTSVMGASKRVVEMLVEDAARQASPDQVFVSVRFGNVLGSRGSAVPIFERQIRAGGPVTVTHPDMVRYFMTIPEAAQLVLQASATGRNGDVYILDMGEPVRIVDVARDLIRLSGLEPDIDIAITFSGVRPGEKLREELVEEGEPRVATEHEKIFVTRPQPPDREALDRLIGELVDAALRSDGDAIRRLFERGIPAARLANHVTDAVRPLARGPGS